MVSLYIVKQNIIFSRIKKAKLSFAAKAVAIGGALRM